MKKNKGRCDVERLSMFLNKELETKERLEIEKHLKTCQSCQNELKELEKTVSLVKSLSKTEAPIDLRIKIKEKIEQPSLWEKIKSLVVFPIPTRAIPAMASAAIALLIIVYVVNHSYKPDIIETPTVSTPEKNPKTPAAIGKKKKHSEIKKKPVSKRRPLDILPAKTPKKKFQLDSENTSSPAEGVIQQKNRKTGKIGKTDITLKGYMGVPLEKHMEELREKMTDKKQETRDLRNYDRGKIDKTQRLQGQQQKGGYHSESKNGAVELAKKLTIGTKESTSMQLKEKMNQSRLQRKVSKKTPPNQFKAKMAGFIAGSINKKSRYILKRITIEVSDISLAKGKILNIAEEVKRKKDNWEEKDRVRDSKAYAAKEKKARAQTTNILILRFDKSKYESFIAKLREKGFIKEFTDKNKDIVKKSNNKIEPSSNNVYITLIIQLTTKKNKKSKDSK